MSKATTKTLVPKLRFSEFRDAGEWSYEPLDELYDFKVTNSYSRDMLNYEKGSVKNIHYGDIHTKISTLFDIESEVVPFINPIESLEKIKPECFCIEGDMIFADASEDLNDVGKSIELVNLNNEKLLSGLHTLLARQKNEKLLVGFGGYLFKSNRIRTQIKREAQGAKVLGISKGRMSTIDITYPSDKKEQQKIAGCLSSIDELITAHTKKHDALQAHKKGLMQPLFPAEGETVPKLRFPEFRDTVGWEEKPLGAIGEFTGGGTPSKSNESYWNGTIPWVSSSDISEDSIHQISITRFITKEAIKESATKLVPPNSILLVSRVGVGKLAISTVPICTSQDFTSFTPAEDNLMFLAYYLKSHKEVFYSFNQGMAIKGFTKNDVVTLKVSLPSDPKEQQKIADCLSSIDERIVVQAQKIESLKAHKKGLMQQLFPADEVSG